MYSIRNLILRILVCTALGTNLLSAACSLKPSDPDPGEPPVITEMLPADRQINWGVAGVWANGTKGIPNRTVVFCNVKVNIPGSGLLAKGDGIQDDTAALRAAISSCPPGQVVYIPQGTYRISGNLNIAKGIVVRGEGPDRTRIINYADNWAFSIEGDGSSIQPVEVESGFEKDSDSVVVSNAGQFVIGGVVVLDQLNDPDLVTPTGVETCSWCGRDNLNGSRAMGESFLVKAKSGKRITFNRPLYFDFQGQYRPQLYQVSDSPVVNAGIEDLFIESVSGHNDGGGVFISNAAYCWVKGVESYNAPKKHIMTFWGTYGCEIRECYFHEAQAFDGDHGYGIHVFGFSCDNLIEDNIFYHLHVGVVFEAGGAGNVVAYNFAERTEHHQPEWFQTHLSTHGAHPYMNLFEGNVVGKVHLDNYFGSSSHNIYLRNHVTRLNPGTPVIDDIVAVIIDKDNTHMTFLGNILGTPGCQGPAEQIPYLNIENNPVIWKIGYMCCAETGNPDDPRVAQTLIRTGNWECSTNSVQWDPDIPEREIPDSLYLTSKPDWFGILTWPPFTPERQGFNPDNLNKIPAQIRFENGPGMGFPYSPVRGY